MGDVPKGHNQYTKNRLK